VSTVWEDTYQPPERGDPAAPVRHAAPGSGRPDGEGAGLDLSFFAQIAVSLGSLADSFKREQDRRDKMGQAPQDHAPVAQGTVGASGFLVLDLGSVPEGRVWQVRRVVIGEATATSAPSGAAFLVAQGTPPTSGAVPTISVVDSWPTFTKGAAGSTYGTHQLFLVAPEHLWVVVTGATTGAQWVASARIEDLDADTYYRSLGQVTE
jgi:hypothetical protein